MLTVSWETGPGVWTWHPIPALPSSDFPLEPRCVHVRHEKCYFVTLESMKVCEAVSISDVLYQDTWPRGLTHDLSVVFVWLRVCVDCPSCPDHLRGPGIRWNHCPSVSNGKSQGAGGCRAFWREAVAGQRCGYSLSYAGGFLSVELRLPDLGNGSPDGVGAGWKSSLPSGLPLTAQPACFWARKELRISRWLCVCLWMWQGMGMLIPMSGSAASAGPQARLRQSRAPSSGPEVCVPSAEAGDP